MTPKGTDATKKATKTDRTPEEITAEVLRLKAEADKLNAEAEAFRAEAAKSAVESRFGEENIEHIKTMRAASEVNTRALLRAEQEQLAAPRYHHIYHFTQGVDSKSIRACMDQMDVWHRENPSCAFEIVFSSPGGSVIDGMALYDYIQQMKNAGHEVITSTIGMAASMAGILLQAGHKRIMGKEAYLLIHQVSFGAFGTFGQVEDEVEFVKIIQERVLDIFASKSKMPRKEIDKNWRRKDWYLDSKTALKHGFVDELR